MAPELGAIWTGFTVAGYIIGEIMLCMYGGRLFNSTLDPLVTSAVPYMEFRL